MIIVVTTLGITINVSSNQQLIDLFETKKGTILSHNIKSFSIKEHAQMGESVRILDKENNEYWANHLIVESVNGLTGFTNALELFDAINNPLIGI